MKDSCCHKEEPAPSSCCPTKKRIDWLLWGSLLVSALAILEYFLKISPISSAIYTLSTNIAMLLGQMWWGLLFGIVAVGLLSQVPREFIMKILGEKQGLGGILRATLAGLLLDLCNHGILLVGMKLYDRGASSAQTMAFLIASPWNSFSLTLILWALIGLKWTLAFILLSAVIAVITGLIFEALENRKILPSNPNRVSIPENFYFFKEAKKSLSSTTWNTQLLKKISIDGIKDSRMIVRWILFGSILAAIIQTFVSTHYLQHYFGATLFGLSMTLIAATLIEVCSEGSTPIAADLLTRASAPGNAFAFLMTGVATDYTEIIAIRQQTKSWKLALFLPLITVPQIIAIAMVLNHYR
ncbi:ATPase [bacterium]|nr:ATPase [bacterium]